MDNCPLYIDYVRECAEKMGTITRKFDTTVRFCVTENYANCPFFKFINNQEQYCDNFIECPLCEYFKENNLEKFAEMADSWRLNHFKNCERYKIRQKGKKPPSNMLPDGRLLEKYI